MRPSTRCVYFDPEDPFGAISPPIYQTATFRQESADEFGEYDYSRSANPTRTLLEKKVADLEHGRFGSAFSSGMAAISAVTRLVEAGDEIVVGNDLYGGTVLLLEKILPRHGISVRYVDTSETAAVENAISEKTKLIFVETPTNPFLRVTDIRAVAAISHEKNVIFAVDNTMLSPTLQNPLDHGADIVIHSATKFLCGHSDVTAGVVVTNDRDLHQKIAFTQNAEGSGLSPFDSWLLQRGIKTLSLRVERQNSNADRVAKWLAADQRIEKVYYPGLAQNEFNDIHFAQATGGGSVISFTTGDVEVSKRIVESTRLFSIAVSFGSVNSSISLPFYMSHASVPTGKKNDLAPPADLIRISVGIEDVNDILEDLTKAIESAEDLSASNESRRLSKHVLTVAA
jgi:cystathionine beta-lyase